MNSTPMLILHGAKKYTIAAGVNYNLGSFRMVSRSKPVSGSNLVRAGLVILRLGLAAEFGYAAWSKLREPWMLFAMSVDAYKVLPEWGAVAVARTLPWAELLLAVMLLAGLWQRVAMPAASVLLAVFFSLMLRSYVRGEGIDCGCFGPGEAISPITLLRDGGLLAASLLLTWAAWRGKRHEPLPAAQ